MLPASALLPQPTAQLQHCQPEDDGDDQQWGNDQEDKNLEPDVEKEYNGVDEQAEGEENVDEVEAQPWKEKMMATDQLDKT